MKKSFVIIVIYICLLLCSCYDVDHYQGKRPIDFVNSYWVCEEYEVSFGVDENNNLIDAEMLINDQKTPFEFLWSKFDNTVNINFTFNSKKDLLSGECEFYKNKFIIKIRDTKGYYSKDQITMTFNRIT